MSPDMPDEIEDLPTPKHWGPLQEVEEELVAALERFEPFNSAHEAWAVLWEELDELWTEVKNNKDPNAYKRMRREATQVAAMAIRFMIEITSENQDKEKASG